MAEYLTWLSTSTTRFRRLKRYSPKVLWVTGDCKKGTVHILATSSSWYGETHNFSVLGLFENHTKVTISTDPWFHEKTSLVISLPLLGMFNHQTLFSGLGRTYNLGAWLQTTEVHFPIHLVKFEVHSPGQPWNQRTSQHWHRFSDYRNCNTIPCRCSHGSHFIIGLCDPSVLNQVLCDWIYWIDMNRPSKLHHFLGFFIALEAPGYVYIYTDICDL